MLDSALSCVLSCVLQTRAQAALQDSVLDDFKLLLGPSDIQLSPDNAERLAAACLVVNALGPKVWAWLFDVCACVVVLGGEGVRCKASCGEHRCAPSRVAPSLTDVLCLCVCMFIASHALSLSSGA